MKVMDVLTLGYTWWMRCYNESLPTQAEYDAAWKAYDEAKRINAPIVADASLPPTERLAAQRLIDRAHTRAVDLEFSHCV